MENKKTSWEEITKLEDCIITYFLYKEGKSIEVISKIRNISTERVEKDIINAKIKLRALKESRKNEEKSLLDKLLEMPKNERLKFIEESSVDTIEKLKIEIKNKYRDYQNPDDKVILIWIVGELKDDRLIKVVAKDIISNNGNIRRLVCSALGKIGNPRAVPYLHKAVHDKKPQVRQYAIKALKSIGDRKTIELLKKIVINPSEKKYVKEACIETIRTIENRVS